MWELPAEGSIVERLLSTVQPTMNQELMEWVKELRTKSAKALTTKLPEDADLLLPWANKRMPWQPKVVNDERFNGLFDYQRAAVALLARERKAILADDVGLGKTIQAIATVEEYRLRYEQENGVPIDGPKLIVAPNSVKGSWMREIRRWLPADTPAYIIEGASPAKRRAQLEKAIDEDAWIIINWEQLRIKSVRVRTRNGGTKTKKVLKEPLFEKTRWLAAVADEIHRAKNRKAQQTQGLFRIQADMMIGLTGTPLMNSPDELWSPLHWLFPREYTAYWRFYIDYVDYWDGPFGKVIVGVKNPDALRFELKDRLVRRTAGEVLSLPGRRRIYDPVELPTYQRKLYEEAESVMWLDVQAAIERGDRSAIEFASQAAEGATPASLVLIPNGAARMLRLLQILETPALLGGDDISGVLDYLEQKYEDSRPAPWVFFTQFKETGVLLRQRLESKYGARVGLYNGDTPTVMRTRYEDQFQAGELDAMVGTIKAMKEGITLTASNLQGWASRSFVPAENEQGEGREDRIGQQNKVMVYIPQPVNTVATNSVRPKLKLKEHIVEAVIEKDHVEETN